MPIPQHPNSSRLAPPKVWGTLVLPEAPMIPQTVAEISSWGPRYWVTTPLYILGGSPWRRDVGEIEVIHMGAWEAPLNCYSHLDCFSAGCGQER